MAIDLTRIEFDCRPVLRVGADTHAGHDRKWVEIICHMHNALWRCSHHHRHWGSVSRCMTRHVQEHTDGG